MGRSWISDHESIQGHFALVHPVPMDSQDQFSDDQEPYYCHAIQTVSLNT